MSVEPVWRDIASQLEADWADSIPHDFLEHPLLQSVTNVPKDMASVAALLTGESKRPKGHIERNLVYQRYHLHIYRILTGRKIEECESIIEWGGGWGCLAGIILKANPSISYTLIDVPVMLRAQRKYLGNDTVTLLTPTEAFSENLDADAFIALWSLSESPVDQQKMVEEAGWLRKQVLIGYDPNHDLFSGSKDFADMIERQGLSVYPALLSDSLYATR